MGQFVHLRMSTPNQDRNAHPSANSGEHTSRSDGRQDRFSRQVSEWSDAKRRKTHASVGFLFISYCAYPSNHNRSSGTTYVLESTVGWEICRMGGLWFPQLPPMWPYPLNHKWPYIFRPGEWQKSQTFDNMRDIVKK